MKPETQELPELQLGPIPTKPYPVDLEGRVGVKHADGSMYFLECSKPRSFELQSSSDV